MSRRNIHKSKRLKSHKPAVAVKPAAQVAAAAQSTVAAVPLKTVPVKTATAQEAVAVRFAELPYELRRIGLFTAFVVVLLIVLWFFLK
ncbi:MAG: hypothetical protein C4542_03640 [Dehalococcoidia bacterium]|nr:MAG: hypothetical protein C4542_03640 [Dehalococcoidia bacterium]